MLTTPQRMSLTYPLRQSYYLAFLLDTSLSSISIASFSSPPTPLLTLKHQVSVFGTILLPIQSLDDHLMQFYGFKYTLMTWNLISAYLPSPLNSGLINSTANSHISHYMSNKSSKPNTLRSQHIMLSQPQQHDLAKIPIPLLLLLWPKSLDNILDFTLNYIL